MPAPRQASLGIDLLRGRRRTRRRRQPRDPAGTSWPERYGMQSHRAAETAKSP